MRNLHITALRVAVILLLTTQMVTSLQAQIQQVWPGDINDNGIVNGVDLLYHGVAEGNIGPERTETGSTWEGYAPAPSWQNNFSDGINFSNADVNGRGMVEQGDRKVLWRQNYGNTHGTINPDLYSIGDAAWDPVLQLNASSSSLEAGDVLTLDLSLGDASRSVEHFFGITFTIKFDPQYFADELTAPLWNPNVCSLNLLPNTWLNGNNGNGAEAFIQLNNEAGEIEVVILRKELGETNGHGDIASIMIIVEDIALLEDINTGITVEKIKMVDQNLIEYPVAGSTEHITILANSQALTTTNHDDLPENAVANREQTNDGNELLFEDTVPTGEEENFEINVYPNPVVNQLTIATSGENNVLESVQLFSAAGQLLTNQQPKEAEETQVDMTNLPKGNYFLQLTTSNGTTVRQVTK